MVEAVLLKQYFQITQLKEQSHQYLSYFFESQLHCTMGLSIALELSKDLKSKCLVFAQF